MLGITGKIEFIKNLVMFVIVVLVTIFIIKPYYTTIVKTEAELQTLNNQFTAQATGAKSPEEAQKDLALYVDKFPDINQAFNQRGQELNLITQLEKLAKNRNLIQKMSLNNTTMDLSNKLSALTLNIELTGSFVNIANYLKDIDLLRSQLSLKSINLSMAKDNQLSAKLLALTYWLK